MPGNVIRWYRIRDVITGTAAGTVVDNEIVDVLAFSDSLSPTRSLHRQQVDIAAFSDLLLRSVSGQALSAPTNLVWTPPQPESA